MLPFVFGETIRTAVSTVAVAATKCIVVVACAHPICFATLAAAGACTTIYQVGATAGPMLDRGSQVGLRVRVAYSQFIHHCFPPVESNLRRRFRSHDFSATSPEVQPGHPHPQSALDRNSGSLNLTRFIESQSLTPYSVSMSARENNTNGLVGTRGYFCVNDLTQTPKWHSIDDKSIMMMVDVDYYLDMPAYIMLMRPIIMYTFSPDTVAGSLPDGRFCTNSDNTISAYSRTGSVYTHPLWEYVADYGVVHGWFHSYFFHVSHRRIASSHWSYVLITPISRIPRVFTFFLGNVPEFGRRKFADGSFVSSRYLTSSNGSNYSIASPSSPYSAEVPETLVQSLRHRMLANPKAFSVGSVEVVYRNCIDEPEVTSFWQVPLLYHYILASTRAQLLRSVPNDTVNYVTVVANREVDEVGNVGRAIHPPMVVGGGVAGSGSTTEEIAIDARITSLLEKDSQLSETFICYAREFIRSLAPPKPLVPIPLEEVVEKQDRPSQRAENVRNDPVYGLGDVGYKTFPKVEPVAKITHPRLITSNSADHRLRMSRFTLAIAKHLRNTTKWYAFGRSPAEIADLVVDLAVKHSRIKPGDYSKYDSRFTQNLVRACRELGDTLFSEEDARQFANLVTAEVNRRSTTRNGNSFRTGSSVTSGRPGTAVLNTFCNALINYIALRVSGRSHSEAIEMLGLYGGDDGAAPEFNDALFIRVAKVFGAVLELEPVTKWVPFLGRIYINPASGSPDSIYDVRRFVKKAHITVATPDVPLALAVQRKVLGFRATDSETPLIRDWCKSMNLKYGEHSGPITARSRDITYDAMSVLLKSKATFPQRHHDDPELSALMHELLGPDYPHLLECAKSGEFPTPVEVPTVSAPVIMNGTLMFPCTDIKQLAKLPSRSAKYKKEKSVSSNVHYDWRKVPLPENAVSPSLLKDQPAPVVSVASPQSPPCSPHSPTSPPADPPIRHLHPLALPESTRSPSPPPIPSPFTLDPRSLGPLIRYVDTDRPQTTESARPSPQASQPPSKQPAKKAKTRRYTSHSTSSRNGKPQ
jgi:hypothetical protein